MGQIWKDTVKGRKKKGIDRLKQNADKQIDTKKRKICIEIKYRKVERETKRKKL